MSTIEFHGAVNTVTGSKFIVSNKDAKVLVDCGMYQGYKDEAYLQNKYFNEDTPIVTDCILSHAHIDHSGLLPVLVKKSFVGNIHSTHATRDLCRYMLPDSVNVFDKELPIIKKILRKKRINERVEPLYDHDDVKMCMDRFITHDYDEMVTLRDGLSFSLHDSCHILGSASVRLNVTENNISHRIWYTSDIGHDSALLTNEPMVPQDIDYLVIESTYGNKKREEEDVAQKVMNAINDASRRGGRIVIPAFSVGRMQTLLLIVHKLHLMGMIPNIPIYVDSPLGVKVTRLYEKYSDHINEETMKFFTDNNINPFQNSMIRYVTEMKDSMDIATSDEPCIIISASGMCEGGHIREHLKYTVGDKNSTVLFVGYNAEGTLGRRLQENNGNVKIDAKEYRVRCKVESISGLSAHADLDYLVQYVENVVSSNALKKIFLVHGDPDAIKNVKKVLNSKGIDNVVIPKLREKYEL